MRILLTGSTGMVGRNFMEHPVAQSFEMLAPTSTELNLFHYESVEAYLRQHGPDFIIHAAGRVGGIQANIRQPVRFLLENMDLGRNLIWGARQAGIRKLINLGSSCMYPRNAVNPLREESVLQGELEPTNEGYALAKIMASRLCDYIRRENPDYQYKTILPCNLYGRWDKFEPEHSHLIPAVIHKLHQAKVNGQKEVEIWGDGVARREFMYAGDLADCLVAAVQNFEQMPSIMNAGIGRDITITEYYQAVAEVVGYQGTFTHDLTKPAGMQQKVVDISRLSAWGWKAKTALRDGLAQTYSFYLKHFASIH
jgi:GDP-L-fucose synthase